MLNLFKDIFGDRFIDNTCIVFTRWEQSKKAKRERKKDGLTEKSLCELINMELRNMGFKHENDLKCFFIDNKIHTMSEEEIKDDGAEDELDFLN